MRLEVHVEVALDILGRELPDWLTVDDARVVDQNRGRAELADKSEYCIMY